MRRAERLRVRAAGGEPPAGGADLDDEELSDSARKAAEVERLRKAEKFMTIGTGEATCKGCGYEYSPKKGDPEYPVSPGTKFEVRGCWAGPAGPVPVGCQVPGRLPAAAPVPALARAAGQARHLHHQLYPTAAAWLPLPLLQTLPADWQCPVCGAEKKMFVSKQLQVAGFAENQVRRRGALL